MKKIIRFEIEEEDGTIYRLIGENAHNWAKRINDIMAFAQIRSGESIDGPEFEILKKDKMAEKEGQEK